MARRLFFARMLVKSNYTICVPVSINKDSCAALTWSLLCALRKRPHGKELCCLYLGLLVDRINYVHLLHVKCPKGMDKYVTLYRERTNCTSFASKGCSCNSSHN